MNDKIKQVEEERKTDQTSSDSDTTVIEAASADNSGEPKDDTAHTKDKEPTGRSETPAEDSEVAETTESEDTPKKESEEPENDTSESDTAEQSEEPESEKTKDDTPDESEGSDDDSDNTGENFVHAEKQNDESSDDSKDTTDKDTDENDSDDDEDDSDENNESDDESEDQNEPVAPPPGAGTKGKWYVVHTYAGHEKKVTETLKQRVDSMKLADSIYEVVVPMRNVVTVKQGKKEEVSEKIFPGYILIRMDMTNESWLAVRTTQGVTSFVGAGTKPTPISQKEVEAILKFMQQEAPKYKSKFSVSEAVKIIDGPFSEFLGSIESIDEEKGKLKVLVSIFGRETPVTLDFLQVKKL